MACVAAAPVIDPRHAKIWQICQILGAQRLKVGQIFKFSKIWNFDQVNRRRQQAPTDIPTSVTPKIAGFQNRRFSVPGGDLLPL